MNIQEIQNTIQESAKIIGTTAPLYSFITSNQLAGYEDMNFIDAAKLSSQVFTAKVFPQVDAYRNAINQGLIDIDELSKILVKNGLFESVEFYLQEIDSMESKIQKQPMHNLDQSVVKWLSAFLDEGLAEWQMPNKANGFYKAWRSLVKYERGYKSDFFAKYPDNALETLGVIFHAYSDEQVESIIRYHLAALPGWVGYIKQGADNKTQWQEQFPIKLEDYLAVRLLIAMQLNMDIHPKISSAQLDNELLKVQHILLQAWEKKFQDNLLSNLELTQTEKESEEGIPSAQMVFCIDTRSELIRRHVESKGDYETFGYAGFFGIAMDYENPDNGISRKSCPPIVPSSFKVSEATLSNTDIRQSMHEERVSFNKFSQYFLRRMKNMLPSAFGFVEGSGLFYGVSLFAKTVFPSTIHRISKEEEIGYENFCEPEIQYLNKTECNTHSISLNDRVSIVKSAIELLGWKKFAPVVLFVGHASHTTNNPFGSSLDCGACAASPGRHNARMLAKIANQKDVRRELRLQHEINIPDNTIFIGAEHNTTTDEIKLFDADIPNYFNGKLEAIKSDLRKAQQTASNERLGLKKGMAQSLIKSLDWSETRPEWGLAKNAAFVIGPRSLSANTNLEGRCFLHSYDWQADKTGKALEAIMQGPMVVTQWINNHYYFSTVDNEVFGGGSKISHNVTGNFGVVQGNGGDLKIGLPLQSVNNTDDELYHQPLRLSVVIQAPMERVKEILSRNKNLVSLLDNQWIYLIVVDPTLENEIIRYHNVEEWHPISGVEAVDKSSEFITELESYYSLLLN